MADVYRRSTSMVGADFEDETLDPRIQDELEKLNKASEQINSLELELDDARAIFRTALSESTQKLNFLSKKLGTCVDKARPYYDSRLKAKESHVEAQNVALRYERACSMHEAAKEMVQLAEQGYMKREQPSDPAWQEMLNHATMKVNEAERERLESEQEHCKTMKNFQTCEEKVQQLQKELKRAISKSRPYFEMKAKFNQLMEDHKSKVSTLEDYVGDAKLMYSEALRNLESISDEIHCQRMEKRKQLELGVRGAGVGAECPEPAPSWDQTYGDPEERELFGGYATRNDFVPPSVIHNDKHLARTESYRLAVDYIETETPTSETVSLGDYDEDYDVPSLEEEFLSLPNTHSPHGKITHISNSDSTASRKEPLFADPLNVNKIPVHETSKLTPQHMDPLNISNVTTSNAQRRTDSISPNQHSELSRENTPTGSPAGSRKSKLQGIILKIDSNMDPMRDRYVKKPDITVKKLSSQVSVASQTSAASGAESDQKASLPLPAGDVDEMSDTDSIASSGTMLDDEQIDMLTLEFSEASIVDDTTLKLRRNEWRQQSLPPKLRPLQRRNIRSSTTSDTKERRSVDK